MKINVCWKAYRYLQRLTADNKKLHEKFIKIVLTGLLIVVAKYCKKYSKWGEITV
jgi:hypothetical protein